MRPLLRQICRGFRKYWARSLWETPPDDAGGSLAGVWRGGADARRGRSEPGGGPALAQVNVTRFARPFFSIIPVRRMTPHRRRWHRDPADTLHGARYGPQITMAECPDMDRPPGFPAKPGTSRRRHAAAPRHGYNYPGPRKRTMTQVRT
jgi:hypothetical protein